MGDAASEPNQETARGVDAVQLVAANDALWASLTASEVLVTGSLFHAQTGHHYTEVLINAQKVVPVASR